MDDIVITIDDIRKHHCVAGIRSWFAAHNLDFRDFMKSGIPASVLLATGDALAVRVVESVMAKRESADG